MVQRIVLRLMLGLISLFIMLISGALILGMRTSSNVFIYQQGFGHASVSYLLDLTTQYRATISSEAFSSYAAYSPDGEHLAYFVYGEEALSLHLANRNSAAAQILLEHVTIANILSWSPNSEQVAILLNDESFGALGVVDIATGEIQRVLVNDVIRDVLWFSEQDLLIITGFMAGDSERNYYHYDLVQGSMMRLEALSLFLEIDLSPDKQQIVGTDNRGNLWLWDVNTGKQTLLTTQRAIIANPTWSQDGQYIAYNVALGDGLHGLFVFALETGDDVRILRGVGRIFSILFLPDHRLIFTRGDVVIRAINIINLDGTGLRKIIPETAEVSGHLVWRP